MIRLILVTGLVAFAAAASGSASLAQETEATTEVDTPEGKGVGHRLLFYLPNRVADVLDVVRLRARIGPGLAVSTRATKFATVFFGTYTSAYVGLPGPRGRPEFPRVVGTESQSGAQLIVVQSTTEGERAPRYAPDEIGAGFQLAIVGADAGVAPVELLDLVVGFLFIDLRKDDY